MIKKHDINQDGFISKQEFKIMMKSLIGLDSKWLHHFDASLHCISIIIAILLYKQQDITMSYDI